MSQLKDFVIDAQHSGLGDTLRMPAGEDLQAFQASLLARMAARAADSLPGRRLAVCIGAHACLIALDQAGEILPLRQQQLTHVPSTRPWFRGLLNIRGNLIGVADLAAMAGAALLPAGSDSHVLVMASSLVPQCGLLVSQVHGLRDISEMSRISNNDEIENDLHGVIGRYKDKGGMVWAELDLARLSQDPEFLQVGR
ncbi:chemotaxis protein CheW [Herbaspirillum sp. NPDC087042]|uniref:chemotaxis protein CheW n=1 Tax=Herbaspirillum sp. NPDC087042 TaxID=3364004 RepID=UPI0038304405